MVERRVRADAQLPRALNEQVGAMLTYAGATVNGERTHVYPPLAADPTRS
ncbi:hypothetical protein [Streptomyces sp. PT12]|nr:hypothetical protein [Streptomyces sp. PT12]